VWAERFTFVWSGASELRTIVAAKEHLVQGFRDGGAGATSTEWRSDAEDAWLIRVTAEGLTMSGESPRARFVPFLDTPDGVISVGDRFPGGGGWLVTVLGFEDVQSFRGTNRDCVKLSFTDGLGVEWITWIAPQCGPVRGEARKSGQLILAGAAYEETEPSDEEILAFFGVVWPQPSKQR
jgi:hypothetical protein